jgi:hypothetical protein
MEEVHGVTTIDPEDAVLATRLVEHHCGLDAPSSVRAILGLDAVHNPDPRQEPGPRAAADTFRRHGRARRVGDRDPRVRSLAGQVPRAGTVRHRERPREAHGALPELAALLAGFKAERLAPIPRAGRTPEAGIGGLALAAVWQRPGAVVPAHARTAA